MVFYALIIISLALVPLVLVQIVQIPWYKQGNDYLIRFNIGNSRMSLPLNIDLINDFTIISPSSYYNPSLSDTAKYHTALNELRLSENKKTKVKLYEDVISVENMNINDTSIKVSNFNFFFEWKLESITQQWNFVSLSQYPYKKNPEFSLFNWLKNSEKIQENSFVFIDDDSDQSWYFGGIPENWKERYKNKYSCNVNPYNNYWSCNMNKILIGNNTYDVFTPALFQLKINIIITTTDFMVHLKNTIFKEYIDDYSCKMNDYESVMFFSCSCSAIDETFPNITFVLDDVGYELTREELFMKYENDCWFSLMYRKEFNPGNNKFILGGTFLKKYMTKFNQEEHLVSFYTDEQWARWGYDDSNARTTTYSQEKGYSSKCKSWWWAMFIIDLSVTVVLLYCKFFIV